MTRPCTRRSIPNSPSRRRGRDRTHSAARRRGWRANRSRASAPAPTRTVQTKLAVGASDDPLEVEADSSPSASSPPSAARTRADRSASLPEATSTDLVERRLDVMRQAGQGDAAAQPAMPGRTWRRWCAATPPSTATAGTPATKRPTTPPHRGGGRRAQRRARGVTTARDHRRPSASDARAAARWNPRSASTSATSGCTPARRQPR